MWIFLPGKMFNTKFHTLNRDCCTTSPCHLKYRWNFYYDFPSTLSEVLKRNKKPQKLTWFKARRICKQWGQNLYSFVSFEDIKKLIRYLDLGYEISLVTSIFLGLYREVKLIVSNTASYQHYEATPTTTPPVFIPLEQTWPKGCRRRELAEPGYSLPSSLLGT